MKSYFADTVESAMAQARNELGPDAVLVTSRAAAPDVRRLGQYEVVFAAELPESSATPERPNESRPGSQKEGGAGQPGYRMLFDEIRDLRERIESWRHTSALAEQPQWVVGEPALENALAELMEAEVSWEMAQQLVAAAQQRLRSVPSTGLRELQPHWQTIKPEAPARNQAPLDAALVRAAIGEEIQNLFRVDSTLGVPLAARKVVALVGPPGAGKTAMIAKFAVKYGLSGRKPALLLSLDTLRVAASEQLRWYASILGMGFQVVSTNCALAQTLEEHRNKELVLIDTAGLTARELEGGSDDADYLAGRADIQKHLVLPASIRAADMARVSSVYRRAFQPSRLIFTRMDEAGVCGPVLCEAARSGLPISFFGAGQRVPEDFEPAQKATLLQRILPSCEWAGNALSAA
jgi:flagellar biosynthesis protein FlhF